MDFEKNIGEQKISPRDAELERKLGERKEAVIQLVLDSVSGAGSTELDEKFKMHFNGLLDVSSPAFDIEVAFEDGRKLDNNLGVGVEVLIARITDKETQIKMLKY